MLEWERRHGRIEPGTIVLLRTDWSRRWPDRLAYLGDDTPGDASKLHFPSYGDDAARLLVEERGAATLGVDVASIDYGQSRDFMVHRIAAARGVPGLENLTNLDQLPPVRRRRHRAAHQDRGRLRRPAASDCAGAAGVDTATPGSIR